MSEQIYLTALPRRIVRESGHLVAKLSIHVAPWLLRDGVLSDFAFASWPATVLNIGFAVELGGVTFTTGERPTGSSLRRARVTSAPDAALFRALLPGDTPVKAGPGARALPARNVFTYPSAALARELEKKYAELATDPKTSSNYPGRHALEAGVLGDALRLHASRAELAARTLRGELDANGFISTPAADDVAKLVDAFEAFHALEDVDEPPAPPPREFHALVSTFGAYREVMRRLGLAIDLDLEADVDADLPPTPDGGFARVAITPLGRAPGVVARSRPTACVLDPDDGVFCSAGRGEIERGLLRLPKKTYSIVQVDVDGALHKNRAVARAAVNDYSTRSEPLGAPAIQSHGLSLVRNDQAAWLRARWNRQLALNATLEAASEEHAASLEDDPYFAEDVTRGYAVDVRVEAKHGTPCDERHEPWRSLCVRQGRFEIFDPSTNTLRLAWGSSDAVDDEGWTSSSITKVKAANPVGADSRAGESVFRWSGWSLAVPFPRKDAPKAPELPSRSPRLRVTYKAIPNSLPKLRFGWTYLVRLRAIDLAGNGLTLAEATRAVTADTIVKHTYRRTEPIGGPLLVSGNASEASSASDPTVAASPAKGRLVDRFIIRRYFDGNAFGKTEPAEYHVLAPRVSVELAKQLGALDWAAARSFDEVNRRDTPWKELPAWEEQLRQSGVLPYLADTTVAGFAFVNLPGTKPSERISVKADSDAPSRALLRLTSGSGAPKTYTGSMAAGIEVALRPDGGITKVSLSCVPTAEAASTFALLEWTRGRTGADVPGLVARGEHVMTTPFRDIELIHALQVPFAVGTVQDISIEPRKVDQLDVTLKATAQIHARSTGSIRLTAHWTEFLPDGKTEARQAEVFHTALTAMGNDQENTGDMNALSGVQCAFTHSLPDGRYRRVRYRINAISRYAEFFDEKLPKSRVGELSSYVDVLNTVKPAALAVESCVPTFLWQEHPGEKAVIRRRTASGIRIFLDGPFASSGEGEMVGVVVHEGALNDADREQLRDVISMVGADPIWTSEVPVVPLAPSAFLPGPHRKDAVDVPLAAVDQSAPANAAGSVRIIPYVVQADGETRYVDVVLDTGATYGPFVRLALVRYQPRSVSDDVKSSFAIPIDVVQLLPTRELQLKWHERTLAASLTGPSYDPSAHAPPILELMVERLEKDWWQTVTKSEITGVANGTGQAAWSADDVVIDDTQRVRQRVSVSQFEIVPSDSGPTRRLVYTDVYIIEPERLRTTGDARGITAASLAYARPAAIAYARKFWRSVCDDGFIAGKFGSNHFRAAPVGTVFQHLDDPKNPECIRVGGETINFPELDDCTHFLSCCLGRGGGLEIPRDFPTGPYGIISATRFVDWLRNSGAATVVAVPDKTDPPLDQIRSGDLIAYYRKTLGRYVHLAMYIGNEKIVCHSYCRSDDPACTWDNEYTLGKEDADIRWTFLRIG